MAFVSNTFMIVLKKSQATEDLSWHSDLKVMATAVRLANVSGGPNYPGHANSEGRARAMKSELAFLDDCDSHEEISYA